MRLEESILNSEYIQTINALLKIAEDRAAGQESRYQRTIEAGEKPCLDCANIAGAIMSDMQHRVKSFHYSKVID